MHFTVVEVEPRCGWSALLEGGAVIGRERACDLTIPDPLVSRRHALVWVCGARAAIEDLDSHNGVYVNDQRCEGMTRLRAGDRVRLGSTVWIVVPVPS